MKMNTVAVSVLVPIYGVEKYIERCARSLFEQNFSDIEYIFVDDRSPDRSIGILEKVIEEYPKREQQIRICRHSANKGLAGARNTAIRQASGTYIIHIDSDDWIEPDMVCCMYAKAMEGDFDIVCSDFYLETETRKRYLMQPVGKTPVACMKRILSGKLHGSVCNKLIKRSLYIENAIAFPDGINMWEDMITVVQIFHYANNVGYLSKAFYHYRQDNPGSYTRNINEASIGNMEQGIALINRFLWEHDRQDVIDRELNYLKLTIKYYRLMVMTPPDKRGSYAGLYREADRFILTYCSISPVNRVILWLLAKGNIRGGSTLQTAVEKLKQIIKRK